MFDVRHQTDGLRVRFAASLAHLDRAVAEVVDWLQQRQAEGSLFDVKLLLREALLNAVLHGSRSDPGLTVELEARTLGDRLVLRVTDQGPGFSWRERLACPPAPEDTCGRGLTIMTLYADEVRFNAVGNQVRLIKRIAGLRGPAEPDAGPADAANPEEKTS